MTSLETIRLGLLRLHAGTGTVGGITQSFTKADEISAEIELLLEGRSEVERVLNGEGGGGVGSEGLR